MDKTPDHLIRRIHSEVAASRGYRSMTQVLPTGKVYPKIIEPNDTGNVPIKHLLENQKLEDFLPPKD